MFEAVVHGRPRSQGSMSLFVDPRSGRQVPKYSQDTVTHRNYVISELQRAWGGQPPLEGAVAVDLVFAWARPKNHIRANGELKDWAPEACITGVDIDKATRLVLDAGTYAGLWGDDAQVAMLTATKIYAATASTTIRVWSI